jgi:WD40 repeat protein
MAFTPDSATLATGGSDGALKLWEVASGQLGQNLPGHNGQINDVVVAADGLITTLGSDKDVLLWNEKHEKGLLVRSDKSDFRCAAVAPDGRLALARNEDLSFWDVRKRRPVGGLPTSGVYIESLFFSADGKWMGALGSSKLTLLGSTGVMQPVDPAQDSARSAAISPDGSLLALAPYSGKVLLYDFSLKTTRELDTPQGVGGVAFSPDGKTLALCWSDDLQLWDVASGQPWSSVDTHYIRRLEFSPDGKHLATADNDGLVNLWRIERERILEPLPGEADLAGSTDEGAQWALRGKLNFFDNVQALAFSADSTRLAAADNQTVRVYDSAHGGPVASLTGHKSRIQAVAFSPDGLRLASGSDDRTARIWELVSRRELGLLDHVQGVKALGFSPDGASLLTVADDALRTADARAGALKSTFNLGTGSSLQGAVFSADGGTIVAAVRGLSGNPKLSVYGPGSDKPRTTLPDRQVLAVSHDGKRLLSNTISTSINVFDTAGSGKPLATLRVSGVRCAAFHPDGKLVALGLYDRSLKLYNAETGKLIASLSGHEGVVNAIAFSPDGKSLATAADDRTVRVWSPKAKQAAQ